MVILEKISDQSRGPARVTGRRGAGATKILLLNREPDSKRLKIGNAHDTAAHIPKADGKTNCEAKGVLRYSEGGGDPEHEAGAKSLGRRGKLRTAGGANFEE